MRKFAVMCGGLAVFTLGWWLAAPPATQAQWGAVNTGIDAARRAAQERDRSTAGNASSATVHNVADEATGGAGSTAPVTYQNRVRPFSYTIPAGWRQEAGEPTGESVTFMNPGATASFTFHFTQMVPSFPRKASVDASLKTAREEMGIGKYIAVKRHDQGSGKSGVIGWETIESARGSGGFQRIQWQCYDGQNYYYSFIAACEPSQFSTHQAALQSIISSIRFSH
jgi:hypothetical protein